MFFSPLTNQWFKNNLGEPTAVQSEAWPAIAAGRHALVSAPTGTGKTLSAFLVFIDRMKSQSRAGDLPPELQLIYISPLKSLAGDIRENLYRPLDGIDRDTHISVSVRTGDTTTAERRKMIKSPPHILITTPESLYLLLTAKSGREMLKTAKTVIVDELHAMIDTKRGAHLMLSLARLDTLAGKPLQRVGLSATIKPLQLAADYFSGGEPVEVIAPKMHKEFQIKVTSPLRGDILPQGTIWPEIAKAVLAHCEGTRTVIAFSEGRLMSEKLAYYINEIAGDGFARTHHGSVSKEQRHEAETALRAGTLRLLCATSSMELGIDVGDIDRVLQVACPASIASVMQRLGRAGHNPGRVSIMHMFPRMASEGLYCGLTAKIATDGGIEEAKPPRLCFDVLAQHLVSMATGDGYTMEDIITLLQRAYPFRDVTENDIENILKMLAGDYEHKRDLPVRPRILYDRINGRVEGDNYSRMLAVFSAGTIPDTGAFAAKTQQGVKIGDLDEEFVTEQRVGFKFLLGSFAWKIVKIDRDTVTVAPTNPIGADPPFWRHNWIGRKLQTGLAFGKLMRRLSEAGDNLIPELYDLGLDEYSAESTMGFIRRQFEATGILPDDRTIIAEHYINEVGAHEVMVHSIYGRQVNTPLSLLLGHTAKKLSNMDVSCHGDDDGILMIAKGERAIPEKLLLSIKPETAREFLAAMLPSTALFNITFRYNAGRALMMGIRQKKRNPLWLQRLRASEMMDSVINSPEHPIIRETTRECLEDYWDLPGLEKILTDIQSGAIQVRELYTEEPSPMTLSLRRKVEFELVYDYTPTTSRVHQSAGDALEEAEKIKPAAEQLAKLSERQRLPENENQLHSLLMMEGDLIAGELNVPYEWFEALADDGRCLYIEPGLWIAAEHQEDYILAHSAHLARSEHNSDHNDESRFNIVRRALRYRGAMDAVLVSERYFIPANTAEMILEALMERGDAIKDGDLYYHADLYERARHNTLAEQRRQIRTVPAFHYAALIAGDLRISAPPGEQLEHTLQKLADEAFPPAYWESVLLPARINSYRPALLDTFLAAGGMFWRINDRGLAFHSYEDIDWDAPLDFTGFDLDKDEQMIVDTLQKRGASFIAAFPKTEKPLHELLFSLMEKGAIHADNFTPVRQWIVAGTGLSGGTRSSGGSTRQRVNARVMAMTSGRWDISRPLKALSADEQISRALNKMPILCRETAASVLEIPWSTALEALRAWEFTGRARRGYFVEGLSGAQYILEGKYAAVTHALENPSDEIIWLAASDPNQCWGKFLAYEPNRPFTSHQGTAVALRAGVPAAVFEGSGRALRFLEDKISYDVLESFVDAFAKRRVFPSLKRLTVKQYPAGAEEPLTRTGFSKVMLDYILRR